MKTYTIGRDLKCDIVINDSTDVISRRHALLNITPSGKMTIIDQSSNGTYVNGIRISQNVPVPVTRKDIVSLAHVAKLDWGQVPKSNQWVKYVIGAVAAVAVITGIIFGIKSLMPADKEPGKEPAAQSEQTNPTPAQSPAETVACPDSTDNEKRKEAAKDTAVKGGKESQKKADQGQKEVKPVTPRPKPAPSPNPAPKPKPKDDVEPGNGTQNENKPVRPVG